MNIILRVLRKLKEGCSRPTSRLSKLWEMSKPLPCKLCNAETTARLAYKRIFAECHNCGFIFSNDYNPDIINKGMGMEGSWNGPGGGGFREYFLVKMLMRDLYIKNFLLFGTGNTSTFENLRKEGVDVKGCDISRDVVDYKVAKYGRDSFFVPEELPKDRKFEGIVAVEVFEHFAEPGDSFRLLMSQLSENGIICGTTDLYSGGPIEEIEEPGYMSIKGHVAYWSEKSLGYIAGKYGLALSTFGLIRPGSVLPDEKFGRLWPNKRVFFLYRPEFHKEYFDSLKKTAPILPIDKP